MKYLLNTNSRTVHNADSHDGRCRLSLIREEHRLVFSDIGSAIVIFTRGKKANKKVRLLPALNLSKNLSKPAFSIRKMPILA